MNSYTERLLKEAVPLNRCFPGNERFQALYRRKVMKAEPGAGQSVALKRLEQIFDAGNKKVKTIKKIP